MKKVSIQDLKSGLSSAVTEAAQGETIVITRHHAEIAQLVSAAPRSVHRGSNVGRGRIVPALRRATRGRYLRLLLEDRGDR